MSSQEIHDDLMDYNENYVAEVDVDTYNSKQNSKERSRNWCFTLNNYEKLDKAILSRIKLTLRSNCTYAVIGLEEAPKTGTKHWQGYLHTANAVRFTTVRDWLMGKAHITRCRGTPEQNIDYCKKGKKYMQFGNPPATPTEKGTAGAEEKKKRWTRVLELAKKGDYESLCEEDPYIAVAQLRNFERIQAMYTGHHGNLKTACGIWYRGESNNGKSFLARKKYPNHYLKPMNKWWCGYKNHETVILDDVDPTHATWIGHFLKIWGDRYVFPAEIKGGGLVDIRPRRMLVTSQYSIDEVFPDEETRAAIRRRYVEVYIPYQERPYEAPRTEDTPIEYENEGTMDIVVGEEKEASPFVCMQPLSDERLLPTPIDDEDEEEGVNWNEEL